MLPDFEPRQQYPVFDVLDSSDSDLPDIELPKVEPLPQIQPIVVLPEAVVLLQRLSNVLEPPPPVQQINWDELEVWLAAIHAVLPCRRDNTQWFTLWFPLLDRVYVVYEPWNIYNKIYSVEFDPLIM